MEKPKVDVLTKSQHQVKPPRDRVIDGDRRERTSRGTDEKSGRREIVRKWAIDAMHRLEMGFVIARAGRCPCLSA